MSHLDALTSKREWQAHYKNFLETKKERTSKLAKRALGTTRSVSLTRAIIYKPNSESAILSASLRKRTSDLELYLLAANQFNVCLRKVF